MAVFTAYTEDLATEIAGALRKRAAPLGLEPRVLSEHGRYYVQFSFSGQYISPRFRHLHTARGWLTKYENGHA